MVDPAASPLLAALSADPRAVRQRIDALERLLEGLVRVPLVGRKVGLDAIAGLVPVLGDVLTAGIGLYLVWEARNLGLPRHKVWGMTARVGFDAVIGAVPLAGDLFDVLYRSNTRNLNVLRRHLDRHHPASRTIDV